MGGWDEATDEINLVLNPEFKVTCGANPGSNKDNLSILGDLMFIHRNDKRSLKVFVDLYIAREKKSDVCSDGEFVNKLKDIFASKSYGVLLSLLKKNGKGDDDYVLELERIWSE